MDLPMLQERRRILTAELDEVKAQEKHLCAKIEAIDELIAVERASTPKNPKSSTRSRSKDGVFLAIHTLKEAAEYVSMTLKDGFSRVALEQRIRSQFPELRFGTRSLEKPIQQMLRDAKIGILRGNVGNRSPTIYHWISPAIIKAGAKNGGAK
jgi:hypothetical protein